MTSLRIGLAVGGGTGGELAEVFRRTVSAIGSMYDTPYTIVEAPHRFESYVTALAGGLEHAAARDADRYEHFCRSEFAAGTRVIFRTAINAESLYLVRQRLRSARADVLSNDATTLLLVRDQMQGFYAGLNRRTSPTTVERSTSFDMRAMDELLRFATANAQRVFGVGERFRCSVVYKYHLFYDLFDRWAKDAREATGVEIELLQPDTANRRLVRDEFVGAQCIIAANEWADIMHVVLLERFGIGHHEDWFGENTYLDPSVRGLAEFQTLHGSADDIADQDRVNPLATMRAAAAIMQRHAGCEGAEQRLDEAVRAIDASGVRTRDRGGVAGTTTVVAATLEALAPRRGKTLTVPPVDRDDSQPGRTTSLALGHRTAVVVIDLQNHFRASVPADAPRTFDEVLANTATLVEHARAQEIEIVFLRFLGDVERQHESWRARDELTGRRPRCLAGSVDAEFAAVAPRDGEAVFSKWSWFDGFLCEGFEEHFRRNAIRHLVFAGVFGDVCVDSTMRSAFQRGFFTTLAADCTVNLYVDEATTWRFMREAYGTRVCDLRQLGCEPSWSEGLEATLRR